MCELSVEVSRSPGQKGELLMKNLFEQYRAGKGTLVFSFNDATTVTGAFVREEDGFLEISGQANAIGQICYVPYPNANIKYMYWKDREAPTQIQV
jgi:hypothetical protein